MVGDMKFEESSLTRFLISSLEPLTEADPAILTEYVTALLKKDKPTSELQKLCSESLFEFLGNDTNPFIEKLFKVLEEGSLAPSSTNSDSINEIQHPAAINTIPEVIDSSASLKGQRDSSPARLSDTEDKEVSEEDDDDRNHKHRRREPQPVSSDKDVLETSFKKPGRKQKLFGTGDIYQNHDNPSPSESGKFPKQRSGFIAGPRATMNFNQKSRGSQVINGSRFGPGRISGGRGRGRTASWNYHDGRLGSVDNLDFASQMASLGSTPSLFGTVAHNPSWVPFGLLHGVTNSGLDTLHPLGFQGTLQPQINPSIGIGIPRQRCRDFEERGFCLRGDMCSMEHGVNRIVVEDVQSLSQFNLPVSLPTASVPLVQGGTKPLTPSSATLSLLANTKTCQSRNINVGTSDNRANLLNGVFSGSAVGTDSDLYDPDQPLWNEKPAKAPCSILERQSPTSLDYSENAHNSVASYDSKNDEQNSKGMMILGTSSSSIQVRSRNLQNILVKTGHVNTADNTEEQTKAYHRHGVKPSVQVAPKSQNEDVGPIKANFTSTQGPESIYERKASRTLFVGGIPPESNKKVLFSHFQKFGVVIDIHIPKSNNKAFVQFSKREEAEAALKAPDAVMGNRFIKLRWANRDNVPDEVLESMNVGPDSVQPIPAVPASSKYMVAATHVSSIQTGLSQKVGAENGPKVTPSSQKQLETLELMRKKQELLEKKRNALLQKLENFEKQATSVKSNMSSGSATKRRKVDTSVSAVKTASCTVIADNVLEPEKVLDDKSSPAEVMMSPASSKACLTMPQQYPRNLKLQNHSPWPSFPVNRFKLDNRPTSFGILPPLPTEIANVLLLKEHFSSFGEFVSVELEDSESVDLGPAKKSDHKYAALVSYTNRHSAEQAFLGGRCLQGHTLTFEWLMPSTNVQITHNGLNKSPQNATGNVKQVTDIETRASVSSAVSTEKLSSVTPNESGAKFGEMELEVSEGLNDSFNCSEEEMEKASSLGNKQALKDDVDLVH